MTELICITCPKGCHLRVDEEKGFAVTGNSCPRGAEYGRNELQHPVRTVTSTVRIQGADLPRLPVKTDRPLAKEKIFDCMALLNTITCLLYTSIAPRPAVIINAAKGMLNHMFMVTSPLAWYIIPGLKSPPKS